jgi:hypothetical protein
MTSFDNNEHMYIAASSLVEQNRILYKDFAYLQMPYIPLVYGYFEKFIKTSYYLLVGKSFSFFFFGLSALVLFLLSRRISRSIFFSTAVLILYLLNHTVIFSCAECSNYAMPLAFSFLAFYFFISSVGETRIRPFLALLSGFCIAVAVGAKLYYALLVVPFMVSAILFPRSQGTKRRILFMFAPLTIGIVIGLLPVLYFMIRDYDAFMFNNLSFHMMNTRLFRIAGYPYNMTLSSKIQFAKTVFFQPENLILISCIVIAFVCSHFNGFFGNVKAVIHSARLELFLSCGLFATAIPIVIIPTPVWRQYFAVPVSIGFLVLVSVYPLIPRPDWLSYKRMLIAFTLLAFIDRGPWLINHADDDWVGIKSHKISQRIQEEVGVVGCTRKMATIFPIYAVEAGIPIYPELATGAFLLQLGDLLTPEQRAEYHGTSPETIRQLMDEEPPGSIFIGFKGGSEMPLSSYANDHGYQRVSGDFGGSELYIRTPRRDK